MMCPHSPRLANESFVKYQLRQGWCAFTKDAMAMELQGALIVIGLGLWMVNGALFQSCPHVYKVMYAVMTETQWGAVFIFTGVIQLYGLLINNVEWRKWVLLIKTALWIFLLCTVLFGEWRAPGASIYTALAFGSVRGFFCLSRGNKGKDA
jgi:hypothetical protein